MVVKTVKVTQDPEAPVEHEVLAAAIIRIADAYDPPRVFIGETWVFDPDRLAAFYGDGSDGLHMAFNFGFTLAPCEPPAGSPSTSFSC